MTFSLEAPELLFITASGQLEAWLLYAVASRALTTASNSVMSRSKRPCHEITVCDLRQRDRWAIWGQGVRVAPERRAVDDCCGATSVPPLSHEFRASRRSANQLSHLRVTFCDQLSRMPHRTMICGAREHQCR